MPTKDLDLLYEINRISKIHTLQRDDIDTIMIDFAARITSTLHIERLSVWIINKERSAIVSMGEYDLPSKSFKRDSVLNESDSPNYFKSISENEILIADNVYESEATKELADTYFRPLNIISLMDIPLRIEGRLVGIMCFEQTGSKERIFSEKDKLFAMSVGLVFASNLEARQRRAIQHSLDKELKEKDILIKEVNHRVKNNISVISSLLNLQASKAKDEFHAGLIEECKNKINAISSIHALTYRDNSAEVNVEELVNNLINELHDFNTDSDHQVQINVDVAPILISVDKVIPLALIINEIITNAYKHAFPNGEKGLITLKLWVEGETNILTIQDNGVGFDPNIVKENSLGIEIIQGLSEQMDGIMTFQKQNGTLFSLVF